MYGIRTFHRTSGRFSSGVIVKFISYIASSRYESIEFCVIRRLYGFEAFSILLSAQGFLSILGKKTADFSLEAVSTCRRIDS